MSGALLNRYRDVPAHLRLERRFEVAALLLCALALLLGALVLFSLLRPGSVDRIVPSADSLQVTPSPAAEAVSLQGSYEIRARPLFWVTRKPEAPVAIELVGVESEEAAELGPLSFVINGVFGSGDSGGFIATMKGEVMRLRVGDSIEGWSVAAINPTNVELVGGGSRRLVPLAQRPVSAPVEPGPAPDAPVTQPAAPVSEGGRPSPPSIDLSRLSLGGAPVPRKRNDSGSKEKR